MSKYLQLCNDNNLKKISLEDNVCFTLRDIFLNISDYRFVILSVEFNAKLTNNIRYEVRAKDFTYTNILNDKSYLYDVIQFLRPITSLYFDYKILENENVDLNEYIQLDLWILQLNELKILLYAKYEEL